MKSKWIIGSAFLAIVIIMGAVFFSANASQMVSIVVNAKIASTSRYLSDSASWKLWWPDPAVKNNSGIFRFRGNEYQFEKEFRNGTELVINPRKDHIRTSIMAFYKSNDSTQIQWIFPGLAREGMLERSKNYFKRRNIQKNMLILLDSFKSYMDDPDKVYRFHIERIPPKDTLLITTRRDFRRHPGTGDTYAVIAYLQRYLDKAKIKRTGFPMTNITYDNGLYKLMVALPVTANLEDARDIKVKRMIPSTFVVVNVSGGPETIELAKQQAQWYMTDFNKTQLAIPYESLITDRQKVTDTAKWQTRIYYPSF